MKYIYCIHTHSFKDYLTRVVFMHEQSIFLDFRNTTKTEAFPAQSVYNANFVCMITFF